MGGWIILDCVFCIVSESVPLGLSPVTVLGSQFINSPFLAAFPSLDHFPAFLPGPQYFSNPSPRTCFLGNKTMTVEKQDWARWRSKAFPSQRVALREGWALDTGHSGARSPRL